MKKIIIAGFAGIGKTFLAKKYKNVVDLESSRFVYDYTDIPHADYEKLKGTKNRTLNKNFPENYIKAIKESEKKYDVICIWLKLEMLPLYEKNKIDYTICYPSEKAFEKYKNLYIQRGNNNGWIQHALEAYPKYVAALKDNKHPKIILEENENLEEYLLKNGYKLIKDEEMI